jgi:hypothetical protein
MNKIEDVFNRSPNALPEHGPWCSIEETFHILADGLQGDESPGRYKESDPNIT